MKKAMVVLAILLFAGAAFAYAQEIKTIKGEVIDLSCYVTEALKARGPDYQTCALDYAKAGEPTAILEENTGRIYVIITQDHNNTTEKMLPYLGKRVEATGTITQRSGITTIDINSVKETEEKPVAMMKKDAKSMCKAEDSKTTCGGFNNYRW